MLNRTTQASHTPTGRRIVVELVNEMQDRLYPLFYRTLAPSLYHVYLHPDDYRDIEGVTPLIVLDAQKALDNRIARLNRRPRWSTLLSENAAIDAPPSGWEIHIHPEANGELKRGELGIVSRLSVPAVPHYDAGTPTNRIVRTVVTSTARRSVASNETAPAPLPASPAPPPLPVPVPVPVPVRSHPMLTDQPVTTPTPFDFAQGKPLDPTQGRADADHPKGFASLAYVDEQGPHVYAIKKDVVSIGRGGREHWVDVQLVTTARVSREHCRIRRDDRGRFFLHDLSTWGTSIDGTPVRKPGAADGALQAAAHEQELPARATIQLADALVIDFQVQATP